MPRRGDDGLAFVGERQKGRPARECSKLVVVGEQNKISRDTTHIGLCLDCVHAQEVRSERDSVFYLCRLSAIDPNFAKYPRLPVLQCRGYLPQTIP